MLCLCLWNLQIWYTYLYSPGKQQYVDVYLTTSRGRANYDWTIHLSPDSILSRYFGADSICTAIFKCCDSILRFIAIFVNFFNTRPWKKVESYTSRDFYFEKYLNYIQYKMFDFQHVCSQSCPEVKYISHCQELFLKKNSSNPKNQRIKTFPSQIIGIFFLIYKGHVMSCGLFWLTDTERIWRHVTQTTTIKAVTSFYLRIDSSEANISMKL